MPGRNLNVLILAAAVMLLLPAVALADDDASPEDKLAKLGGKDLYKALCKVCHTEDAEAGWYTPMDLIEEQWEEFYDETWVETHADLTCPADETKKVVDVINKDLLKKLRKFCIDHAADSEQPMTCG